MSRIDQINHLLHTELASLISREMPMRDFMITITDVDCSADLANVKVGVSVLPDKFYGTALENLRKHSKEFRNILKKRLNLKNIPKINWVIDKTEKKASEIEDILEQINNNEV